MTVELTEKEKKLLEIMIKSCFEDGMFSRLFNIGYSFDGELYTDNDLDYLAKKLDIDFMGGHKCTF